MPDRSTKNQPTLFFSTKPLLRRISVFLSQSSFYQSLSKKFHTEVVFSRRSLKAAKKSQIKGLEVDRDGFGKKVWEEKKLKGLCLFLETLISTSLLSFLLLFERKGTK